MVVRSTRCRLQCQRHLRWWKRRSPYSTIPYYEPILPAETVAAISAFVQLEKHKFLCNALQRTSPNEEKNIKSILLGTFNNCFRRGLGELIKNNEENEVDDVHIIIDLSNGVSNNSFAILNLEAVDNLNFIVNWDRSLRYDCRSWLKILQLLYIRFFLTAFSCDTKVENVYKGETSAWVYSVQTRIVIVVPAVWEVSIKNHFNTVHLIMLE